MNFEHENEDLKAKLQTLKVMQRLKERIDQRKVLIKKLLPKNRKDDSLRENFLVNLREIVKSLQNPLFREFMVKLIRAIGHACSEYLSCCIDVANLKGLRAIFDGNAVTLDNKNKREQMESYDSVIMHYC